MTFYERCEIIANQKNLSFYKIAQQVGVSGAAITGWKNGSFPKSDVAVKVASLLGVSVEYLITGEDHNIPISPDEIEFLQIYRKIHPQLHQTAKEQLLSLEAISEKLKK